MRSMRSAAFGLMACLLLMASAARAADTFVDCPPGSSKKEEGSYSWCEPSVCNADTDCTPNVCREAGLCMQVGSLNKPGEPDGGAKLMATQICAEDKQCPTKQTCSKMKRCLTPAQASKSELPIPPAPEAKKSSCGCETVGAGSTSSLGFAALGLSALLVRARRRGSRRKSL
jgi:MYXO-CTERM domain-containing protein